MDWNELIERGELKIGSVEEAQQKNVFPNRLAWLKSKLAALVVYRDALGKPYGYEVRENGLNYIKAAQEEGHSKAWSFCW